jgi:hypothetical protein
MCADAHLCTRYRAFHEMRMREFLQWIIDTQTDTFLPGQDITYAETARQFRDHFTRATSEYQDIFNFYTTHAGTWPHFIRRAPV